MEREVTPGYSCTLKSGETVVYYSDHTQESSVQQNKATVSGILSYHGNRGACCSVGTQTEDDVIRRDTVTNTSTETDLNAVGDRKTLEALLRWALAICTSENNPIPSDTRHFAGASFATAFSNTSSATIPTKTSNFQLENVSNNETWQEVRSNDSPKVMITDVKSLGSSELLVPEAGGSKLSLYATCSEYKDELPVPGSGGSNLSLYATCSEGNGELPVPGPSGGNLSLYATHSDDNIGAPLEEVMEVDGIGGENGTYLKLSGQDTSTCSSESLLLSDLHVCNMQSMSSQGMVQSSSGNMYPREDREGSDNQSQGELSTDSQQMSGVGSDIESQGAVTFVTQGRVAPIAHRLQQLRSTGYSMTFANHLKCEKCNEQFDNEQDYNQHNWNHIQLSRNQAYKCPTCDKTFVKKDNLKRHVVTHTKEKPFECSVCGKRYPRKDSLKRHSQVHVDKLHRCLQCDKTFASNESLQIHIQRFGHTRS